MFLRRSAFFFIPYESNFYMISYIALFYTSFLYHAIKTPEYFGRLIISALLLQVFGTPAYLGGVCGRGRNPTLRLWASAIPRLDCCVPLPTARRGGVVQARYGYRCRLGYGRPRLASWCSDRQSVA